ncbi:hypothetical protein BDK51DRAFT_45057 [Blyttiomyces helicus]|uniref:SH3 domain-containing protein n=1 Tax=Blyttiomyces helicus TaxID=388810 RepID=A0A4P9WCU3_9FUNG|nr:hypothetical protein BDK51DRAFT_45057 [Blyttiomyces helicus]|eukprot:RKO90152.1 hypothetical protein BDK51DRAFT_45057 [Blyttiomyces helicus]
MSLLWQLLFLTTQTVLAQQSQYIPARTQGALVTGPSSLVFVGGVLERSNASVGNAAALLLSETALVLPYRTPTLSDSVASLVPLQHSPYPLNPALAFAASCAVDVATMYCYGGQWMQIDVGLQPYDSLSYFWTMDLITYTWNAPVGYSSIGPLYSHSLVKIENSFYIFGGSQNDTTTNDLWRVPIDSLTSPTRITSSGGPSPRDSHCGANLGTDAMLVYGGENPPSYFLPDTFVFHAHNSSWSKINTAVNPRATFAACASLSDKVYLFGGSMPDINIPLNELWSFDLTSMSWTLIMNASDAGAALGPSPRESASMTTLGDRYLVVSGGYMPVLHPVPDPSFHFFDTITASWLSGPPSDFSSFAYPVTSTAPSSRPTTHSASSSSPMPPPASSAALTTPTSSSTSVKTPPSPSSSSLPTAAIAGGAAAGAILLLVGIHVVRKSRGARKDASNASSQSDGGSAGTAGLDPALATSTSLPLHAEPSSKHEKVHSGSAKKATQGFGDLPFRLSDNPAPYAPGAALWPSAPSPFEDHPAPYAPGSALRGDASSSPSGPPAPDGSFAGHLLHPSSTTLTSERDPDLPPAYHGANRRPASPPTVYRALRGYIPQNDAEVGCKLGDQIVVRQVRPDGWAEVLNVWTGQEGILSIANVDVGEDFVRDAVQKNVE